MLIHLKEFLKFTKKQYQNEISKIEIESKMQSERVNHEKIEFELETLKAEYKVLIPKTNGRKYISRIRK